MTRRKWLKVIAAEASMFLLFAVPIGTFFTGLVLLPVIMWWSLLTVPILLTEVYFIAKEKGLASVVAELAWEAKLILQEREDSVG